MRNLYSALNFFPDKASNFPIYLFTVTVTLHLKKLFSSSLFFSSQYHGSATHLV